MTRRLQVMPEVLPAPTTATPNASVRSRTVAHMQRLLATAAAIPLAGCTRADTQGSQTVTIPVSSATTTATATATDSNVHGSLLPPPTATATATATPTATAPDMGYAVVDPMPAPARCMGLAAASKATAAFKRHGADWALEITLTLPTNAAWTGTAFPPGATLSPWSGTLVSSNLTSHTAKAVLRVAPGSSSAGLTFPVTCAAGSGSVALTATFSGAPSASTKVSLSQVDY